ncbi:MAG: hypothetical protein Q4E37_02565 [Tissierellia bacterium]|nr:hypothetical protein [Tissierellia bacterium]
MKRLGQIGLVLLVIIAGVYFAGVAYFTHYFQPRTYINGVDYSLEKKDQLEARYSGLWEDYSLKIEGRGEKKDRLRAADFAYRAQLKPGAQISQAPYHWPLTALVDKTYNLAYEESFDEVKLGQAMLDLHVVKDPDIVNPAPVSIVYEEGKGYGIKEAEAGNRLDWAKLKEGLVEAVRTHQESLDLDQADLYAKADPGVDRAQLEKKVQSLNEIGGFSLAYQFGETREELSGEALLALYGEGADGSLQVNPEAAEAYVGGLAARYNTAGMTRDFPMTGGGVARVPGGFLAGSLTRRPPRRPWWRPWRPRRPRPWSRFIPEGARPMARVT